MPNIGVFHPQIVHFIIVLGLVGVGARILSLTGRFPWMRQAAAALLIMAGLAGIAAVKSGTDAHGPVERIPGVRDAVMEHEEAGERARTAFLLIAGIELIALGAGKREQIQKALYAASALAGLVGAFLIYEAGEHGGDLVYAYAGGPGLRSGDSTDVRRLLVAGLYNQAVRDREAGRGEDAARLIEELARRMPGDQTVAFLAIESRIRDRGDAGGALAELEAMSVPADNPRLAIRKGTLTADALNALGMRDSAVATLRGLAAQFPESRGVQDALKRMEQ
jgi:uncharacterized membrane protein